MAEDNQDNQRRRNARFTVRQGLVGASKGQELIGISRDVNAEGLFFFTSTPVAEGDHVDIRLNLPAGSIFSDEVLLLGRGKAVRVEHGNSEAAFGIAVAFEKIEIHHSTSKRAGSE